MARDIEPIERRVGLTGGQLPMISGGQQLINSLQKFQGTIAGIAESAATEQAAIRGMMDREEDKQVNLAPGITRPTAAYNQAYRNTDARIVGRAGLDMIADAMAEASNPAKLNSNSVQQYNNKVSGIIDGIVSQSLPENRSIIKDNLERAASSGRNRLQQSVYRLENQRLKQDFQREYGILKQDLSAAIQNQDMEAAGAIRGQIQAVFQDWGTLSQDIANVIPDLEIQLQEQMVNDKYLGEFIAAQDLGEGGVDAFLNDFVEGKQEDLRPEQKIELVSKMVRINNASRSAQSGFRALSMQRLENNIDNPQSPDHIQTQEELESSEDYLNLTPLQQQQITHKLIVKNSQEIKAQSKYENALQQISNGRAAFVEKGTINDMFLARLEQVEIQNQRPADLNTQFQLVQEFQTNVPKFDALMSDMLTSGDTNTAMAAGALYSSAKLSKQSNLINLSGDAAVIAEKMSTQYNMTANPSVDVVKGVLRQVLERNEPQVQERLEAATKAFSANGPAYYREVMGVEPDAFSDQGAYAVFKEAFTTAMVRGSTQEEAARIAKNSMKAWGNDKWFPDDVVALAPPSKMLPMSEGNYNIRNQIIIQFDAIKNANNALRQEGDDTLPLKFAREFKIPEDRIKDVDFVYEPLDGGTLRGAISRPFLGGSKMKIAPPQVEVEVNGVKSDLKLISSPQTLASPDGGLIYGLFAKDKFGIYQQLPDPRSQDGLAYVVLNDVDVTAPGLAGEEADERLVKTLEKARSRQRIQELEQNYLEVYKKGSLRAALGFEPATETKIGAKVSATVKEFAERLGREPMSAEEIKGLIDESRTSNIKKRLDDITGGGNE